MEVDGGGRGGTEADNGGGVAGAGTWTRTRTRTGVFGRGGRLEGLVLVLRPPHMGHEHVGGEDEGQK